MIIKENLVSEPAIAIFLPTDFLWGGVAGSLFPIVNGLLTPLHLP